MSREKKKGTGLILILTAVVLILAGVLVFLLVRNDVIGGKNQSEGTTSETASESAAQEAPAGTTEQMPSVTTGTEAETTEYAEKVLTQEELSALPLKEAAQGAVGSFLALYRACDPKAGTYLTGGSDLSFPEIQSAIATSLKYEIHETRLIGNEDGTAFAEVDVTIETPSFRAAYEATQKELSAEADAETILKTVHAKLLDAGNASRVSFAITVQVLDFVTSREIQMSPELSDALTGGLMSYLAELAAGGK